METITLRLEDHGLRSQAVLKSAIGFTADNAPSIDGVRLYYDRVEGGRTGMIIDDGEKNSCNEVPER